MSERKLSSCLEIPTLYDIWVTADRDIMKVGDYRGPRGFKSPPPPAEDAATVAAAVAVTAAAERNMTLQIFEMTGEASFHSGFVVESVEITVLYKNTEWRWWWCAQ